MKFTIANFRGISHAEINTAKITLIAGKNYAGKTSIIQAIQAALTGNTIPIEGLKKSNAGRLVRAGTATGEVVAASDAGTSSVVYPEASRSATGTAPEIDEYAAGVKSLLDIPTAQRAEAISDMLSARPTTDELLAELKKHNVTGTSAQRIADTIAAQGWDAAHGHAKETGARLKGSWENETGERYGDKKAASWLPAAWELDLDTATEQQLTDALKQETDWLEAAISHSAVESAEIAKLEESAKRLPVQQNLVAVLSKELQGLFDCEQKIRTGLGALPPAKQTAAQACPHCGNPLSVDAGKIAVATVLTDEQLAERRSAIEECEKSLSEIKLQITQKNESLSRVKSVLLDAQAAAKRIAEIAVQPAATGDVARAVDDCRANVARAENRLQAFRKRVAAQKYYQSIASNADIIALLAPDGLRLAKLQTVLAGFNSTLSALSTAAKWGRVSMGADMSVSYNGTPYMLCSESEQFRARVTLQIAIAAMQSDMVLIDRADILDAAGRNSLLSLVLSTSLHAVIAMTIDSAERVPAVAKIGGVAYWIENGIAWVIS